MGVAIALAGCTRAAEPVQPEPAAATPGSNTTRLGVQALTVTASGGATFNARVWYPTSSAELQTVGATAIRPGYQAVVDGTVSLPGAAPIVVLVHGSGSSADALGWIARDLVAHGAVVVGADHPASSGGDLNRRSLLEVWTQPQDVRTLLDQLQQTRWSTFVDRNRIGAIGFSLGGASAMLLAGARLDFARFPEFCKTHDDGACTAFRQHFGAIDAAFLERANADHSDRRLRAAVAIAPGFTEAMTADSLQTMATPALIITAERDQQLPPETHVRPILGQLRPPSGHVQIRAAHHFSFMPPCRPNAVAILTETKEEFVCQEHAGRTREQIHAEALEAIVKFLRLRGVLPE